MRLNKYTFTVAALLAYLIAFAPVFSYFPDSIQIASILMIGCFGWLHGIRIGLLSVVLIIALNCVLLFVFADNMKEIILTYYPIGTVISIALTLATGYLHDSRKKLEQDRASLEDRVADATRELEEKTRKLILKDEMERIRIGQDLHDGVGQCLTGMLLHCESLAEKLDNVGIAQAAVAHRMTERIRSSLQVVRKLSRSQLPIKPDNINLEDTFDEMADYFQEIADTMVSVKCSGNSSEIPVETSQHLYRIAQEAIHSAVYECEAGVLKIGFHAYGSEWALRISAAESSCCTSSPACMDSHTMKYRAKLIGGTLSGKPTPNGGFELMCTSEGLR